MHSKDGSFGYAALDEVFTKQPAEDKPAKKEESPNQLLEAEAVYPTGHLPGAGRGIYPNGAGVL